MTPKFANAVDPIFLEVLRLLEKIEQNVTLDAEAEQRHLQHLFREAEAKLGERTGWDLARYALAVWIDEVLIEAPWSGRDWWVDNLLEFALFKTRDRATQFYLKAKEASELKSGDAFEVYYLCVVLGYYGFYALSESKFLADSLQLPSSRESWAEEAQRRIQLGLGRPPIHVEIVPGQGAPALEGRYALLGTVLVGVILLAFTAVLTFYIFAKRQPAAMAQDVPHPVRSALAGDFLS